MKVWIVTKNFWEFTDIVRVFDTLEKAQEFAKNSNYGHEFDLETPFYDVVEFEVN